MKIHQSSIKVDSPTPQQPDNDNNVTIELPYPAVSLVVAQSFGYIRRTRTWAWFVCASFYDADDNELWHTEILVGSQLNYNLAAEHLFGSDSTNFSPSHNRIHNNFSNPRAHHANIINPDTLSAPDPNSNSNNNIIVFPNPRQLLAVNTQSQRPPVLIPHQRYPQGPLALNNNYPQYYPRLSSLDSNSLNMSGGWNPRAGWDNGDAGNRGRFGGGPAPNNGFPVNNGSPLGYNPVNAAPMYSYPQPMPGQPFSQGPVYTMPQNGFQHPLPVFQGQDPRFLNPHPVVTADSAALNFQNSTGGVGCEPGYNYYFPAQHTKIHVIRTKEPPWRLAAGMSMNFGAYHVPCNSTLGELMKGFGALNADSKKNRITEINPGGNGNWYKGMTWTADDKDKMALTIKEIGWDETRSGRTGEKPVVWVWITNT
ncbi:hypothetical protein PG993_000015 [Apiospora rasikravindrae]|uniref:Uncharacterized protein n=1 Tax=Apiospora rasikravindrae TaxID=990691 RepID=A0ABR1U7C7_9PEZI